MRARRAVVLMALFLITVRNAGASTVAFRLGRSAPRITSALWDDNLATFAIERDDFDGFLAGVELAIPVSPWLDLTLGAETASSHVASHYRDFVRDDGTEIVQDLRLRLTPATVGLRLLPIRGSARLNPYVVSGLAFHFYEYLEEGEFIDFDTLDVFVDSFSDRGIAFGGYLGAGVEVPVGRSLSLFGEYRRYWAASKHGDDFEGFGEFDLTSNQVIAGVSVGF